MNSLTICKFGEVFLSINIGHPVDSLTQEPHEIKEARQPQGSRAYIFYYQLYYQRRILYTTA